jgi:endonuclease-3
LPIIDELVLTVLSQHTSDLNRDRAFAGLLARFGSWDEVRAAPVTELADSIRMGGIADVKARRIQEILGRIAEQEGSLDLARLEQLSDEDVEAYLVSLPGVGPKTAACVLAFSMGRPAFPIDTHVHRIALRLGWLPPKATAEQAHRSLLPVIPPDIRYDLHVAFIEHGRKLCKAQIPLCSDCVLFDLCPTGPVLLAEGAAR